MTELEEHIKRFAEKYCEKSGYALNPDTEMVDTIITGLAANKVKYGFQYCPCRIVEGDKEKDRQKICPCVWHKDEIAAMGHCHCGLFVKKGK